MITKITPIKTTWTLDRKTAKRIRHSIKGCRVGSWQWANVLVPINQQLRRNRKVITLTGSGRAATAIAQVIEASTNG